MPAERTSERKAFEPILPSSSLAMFAVGANSTAIMAALPSVRAELSLSAAGVEWAVNSYLVVSAAFIVLGGRAADRLGARLAAMVGLALFGAASCVIATAGSEAVLLAGRALQGFAVAFAVPSTLAAVDTSATPARKAAATAAAPALSRKRVTLAVAVLVALLFSKNVYSASLGSYFTLYLMSRFGIDVATAQLYLFAFLVGIVGGTILGGAVGDKVGRIPVMWFSIVGALPFALMLPYANLFWTGVLAVTVAMIMASAFSAILVYAQELLPGRVGLVAGMFFGFSFGLGGLGAAALGQIADWTSIDTVYRVCSFLPLIGLLTAFLPNIERKPARPKGY